MDSNGTPCSWMILWCSKRWNGPDINQHYVIMLFRFTSCSMRITWRTMTTCSDLTTGAIVIVIKKSLLLHQMLPNCSPEFIGWALQPPGWIKEWHCGVRRLSYVVHIIFTFIAGSSGQEQQACWFHLCSSSPCSHLLKSQADGE